MATRKLTDDMLDPETPDDVKVTASPRPPITDPTLGISVTSDRLGTPRHRLVAIGDSLTHGFQSLAIYNTSLSYPMIIAREMGWGSYFRYPRYGGPGGLPLNLEYLIRRLEYKYGNKINWWESASAFFAVRQHMDEVEDYWERGAGAVVRNEKGINHNLAVYGWDLRDALSRNADICAQSIGKPKDQLLDQIVENANERAALRVLNSARDTTGKALTPLEAAAALSAEGSIENESGDGIETLIVFLGANNALGTIENLKVRWSDKGYDDLKSKNQFTVWRPTHFEKELKLVVAEVEKIRARHVIWLTVPHVTIAPIARGVDKKVAPKSRYFPYYTRPWISNAQFDPREDPHITEQQARAIDSAIDQYNEAITNAVQSARTAGKDWYLFDAAGMLDRLAAKRYIEDPQAQPDWWYPYALPPALQALNPPPDSYFFCSDKTGRKQGGLFSLDGVHPTTIAYGLIAQELINIMQLAVVTFFWGDGKTPRVGPISVDFKNLIALDTLISDPPQSLDSDIKLIGWIDEKLDLFKRLFGRR